MSRVRIITDSNAFLAEGVSEKYQIEVIPHRIKLGGSLIEEDSDFTADELFTKMQDAQTAGLNPVPGVQAADPEVILDAYRNVGNESEQIVSIHMSAELSGMWQHARRAAELLKGRYTIRVIDSLSASFGLGLLVEQAAKVAEEGGSANDVARVINGTIPHLYIALFSESLSFLERSAGLGASQSVLGAMLGIKAMLMMEDGRLIPLEKVQTREEVVEKLTEFVAEFARVERVGVLQHNYEKPRAELIARLGEVVPSVAVEQLAYPPSLATYLGPNIIGVVVYEGTY